jgi:hypothetical protein
MRESPLRELALCYLEKAAEMRLARIVENRLRSAAAKCERERVILKQLVTYRVERVERHNASITSAMAIAKRKTATYIFEACFRPASFATCRGDGAGFQDGDGPWRQ